MTDQQLVEAAITAAGVSSERFAHVIGADPRKVRRWLDGTAELSGIARVVCRAIVARPALFAEFVQVEGTASGTAPTEAAPHRKGTAEGTGQT